LGLLASACAGGADDEGKAVAQPSTGPAGTGDAQPVRADADLVIWTDPTRTGVLTELANDFGEANKVTTAVQGVSTDLLASFISANGAGNGPDVLVGTHDWIGRLVQNGAIEKVRLSENDQQLYEQTALAGVRYNGDLYGLPFAFSSVALFRNTKMAPKAPTTIEQLESMARASRVDQGAEQALCLPVGSGGDAYHLQPLYSSAGGYVFGTLQDGEYDAVDLGVGRQGSLDAAAKIAELGRRGVLSPSVDADNAVSMFTEGRCPFLEAGPWALQQIREAGTPYAVTPMVGFAGMGPARPFVDVQAFFIATKGKNTDLAERFVLDGANSPQAMTSLYRSQPLPPAMRDVLTAVSAKDRDTAAFASAASAGVILPALPEMTAVWEPLGKAEVAIIGGADPNTTMQDAGTQIAEDVH
jgi:arabinogalactan oligomer/maltooligosaccharide transport system substrate-binding protein